MRPRGTCIWRGSAGNRSHPERSSGDTELEDPDYFLHRTRSGCGLRFPNGLLLSASSMC
jgi:hypothetical protein